jgi:hypothetical protein
MFFLSIIRPMPWMVFLQQELKDNTKEKLIVACKNHGFLLVLTLNKPGDMTV